MIEEAIIYIAQPYFRRGRQLIPGAAIKATDAEDANRRAHRAATATGNAGAVAIRYKGFPGAETFEEPAILARFGDVPEKI